MAAPAKRSHTVQDLCSVNKNHKHSNLSQAGAIYPPTNVFAMITKQTEPGRVVLPMRTGLLLALEMTDVAPEPFFRYASTSCHAKGIAIGTGTAV